jgi:predicted dehydrogenase
MDRVRIGVVGAGFIGRRHLDLLGSFPDVRVAAVADAIPDRAREAAQRAGATAYPSLPAMLDAEPLDAVYLCLPPFAHGEPEAALVARGIPFFVEKPLATDFETAEAIARGVAEAGLVTAVGYHWRYLDTTARARALLVERPARLALGYWLDSTPPPPWWAVEAQSGGQMIEQTTHIFDLARVLVGEVATVYASGSHLDRPAFPAADVLDVSTASLRFVSGAVGAISSTCLLNWPHRIGLHLFSEGLALELTEFELAVDEGHGRDVQKAAGDPFAREDRDFIDAVAGRENRIRVPYAEALRTHLLTTAAVRSAHEGVPLKVTV